MAARWSVAVDEARCDGCGACITACPEGVLALVDGKARVVRESACDGLGACIGECPQGAIAVSPVAPGAGVARPAERAPDVLPMRATGCPGSRPVALPERPPDHGRDERRSALRHWPVQLHLVAPGSPHFRGADLLLAADCVAYARADFHRDHLAGHALAIACPKLDAHQEVYLDKLVELIGGAGIASLTVIVMEVPCCGGLVRLARAAAARAGRLIPMRAVVVGIDGRVLEERAILEAPAR